MKTVHFTVEWGDADFCSRDRHLCSSVRPPAIRHPELPAGGWTELREASIILSGPTVLFLCVSVFVGLLTIQCRWAHRDLVPTLLVGQSWVLSVRANVSFLFIFIDLFDIFFSLHAL